jgi:hypothetical protein
MSTGNLNLTRCLTSGLNENDTQEIYSLKQKRLTEINQPLVDITDGAYTNEVQKIRVQ